MKVRGGMNAPLAAGVVSVGGRPVEVYDIGDSRPGQAVVVLLNGAGDTARSWLPVQRALGLEMRVIAFERSGVAGSEPGASRTLDGFLAEIDGVLDALVPGQRVLLVGHSLGALLARVHAARHPERVAGMVLLDATPDRLGSDRLRRVGYRVYIAGIAAARGMLPRAVFGWAVRTNALPLYPGRAPFLRQLDERAREDWLRAVEHLFLGVAIAEMRRVLPVAAEAATALQSGSDAAVDSPLGDLPVAVITSGTYGRGWIRMHEAFTRRYPRGTHRVSGDRFHSVHLRHTATVVETVRAMARHR